MQRLQNDLITAHPVQKHANPNKHHSEGKKEQQHDGCESKNVRNKDHDYCERDKDNALIDRRQYGDESRMLQASRNQMQQCSSAALYLQENRTECVIAEVDKLISSVWSVKPRKIGN